jgi:hypothetical protein
MNEKLRDWERHNLTGAGVYMGIDLSALGYAYSRGQSVPSDRRFSAMLDWEQIVLHLASAHNAFNLGFRPPREPFVERSPLAA